MKRHHLCGLLVLCLAARAAAAPSSFFVNNLVLTTRTNIDATIFVNNRTIFFDMVDAGAVDSAVFQTRDTLYYTNNVNGTMVAQPGFYFRTSTATGIHPAASLNNRGLIAAVDAPVMGFEAALGTIPVLIPPSVVTPGFNVPVAGLLSVSATNIINTGTLSVGDRGVLQIDGTTVKLGGSVAAGTVSDADTNAAVGRGIVEGFLMGGTIYPFFAPPADIYDIAWGATNGASSKYNVEDLGANVYDLLLGLEEPILLPYPTLNSRNGVLDGLLANSLPAPGVTPEYIFPFGALLPLSATGTPVTAVATNVVTPNFQSYVYETSFYNTQADANAGVLSYEYNIVLVNEQFADPDISVNVRFLGFGTELEQIIITNGLEQVIIEGGAAANILTNGDAEGLESIVQFTTPLYDPLTGQTVSNSLFLLDTGQLQVPAYLAQNGSYPFDARPLSLELTRIEPAEWATAIPANLALAPIDLYDLIYTTNTVNSFTMPMTNVFYVAQAGRNPEVRDGLFPYTKLLLGPTQTGFPDITNEPGRIEINANTLDMTGMNYRANGFVKINAPTVTGMPAGADCGNLQLVLGNLKRSLEISNLVPSSFHRLRGPVGAYSATWMNTETNDNLGTGTNGIDKVTNYFHYHVLIVDQALRSSFLPTALDVSLSGGNVVLDDPLGVMGKALIRATNLTINANFNLTATAGPLLPANLPLMKTLRIGTNGSVTADTEINLGVVSSLKQAVPTVNNTPILSVTNGGLIGSGQTEIQTRLFYNNGNVIANGGGQIILNTISNYLGTGRLGLPNTLVAGSDINLISTSIQVTNSQILAGQAISGQLLLYAPGELTDHYPGAGSTNVYVTNVWTVTGGFSLPVKPAKGDLFATQIATIAANSGQTIVHVWAGQDRGATLAGFANNEVIGHLLLDRTTNATLRFSAAGKSNAMYVDYLELRDLAFTDYHNGLVVDSNLTIYFANANVDPVKIHNVYPNIIWVPQFAGPNSTADVEIVTPAGTNLVPVNALLRSSASFASFIPGVANANVQFPIFYTNAGPNPVPSPAQVTSATSVPVSNTNGVFGQSLELYTIGMGRITSSGSLTSLQAGQNLSLTAVPASGWLFLNWSWPGPVSNSLVTNPAITFKVPTNAFSFVTANFITNPLASLAGSYYGLFTNTNGVTVNSSGFVTFTLNSQALFSGKLSLGTNSYPFSSQFNISNYSATALATNGTNRLVVALEFGGSSPPGLAMGTVSNAVFDATLVAYQAPSWTVANPAPQAGSYTLVLTGNTNAAASPGGDSYGTVTVDPLGNLKAIVTLADNAASSQVVPLSGGGLWPLYIAPSGVAQSLLGWVAFDTNGIGGNPAGLTGTVTWVKAAGPGTYYTKGFTNTSVLLGSVYSAAFQRTNGLALANPSIALSGGNLTANISDFVKAGGLETYTTTDKSLTLTINPTNGVFGGKYAPAKGNAVSLGGVVLQNTGVAGGFFLGTNQSGAVWLQGN